MTTKQIKTFEQLIARELQGESGYNARVQAAYMEMYKHFSNEEYLYGIPHTQIITKIYTGGFYKHCSVGALSRELYYDFKTLLSFRKRYIELFARYYLNLEKKTDDAIVVLYEQLIKDQNKNDPKQKQHL